MRISTMALCAALVFSTGLTADDHPKGATLAEDSGQGVRILSPADGATVSSPFTVFFGLNGMGVAPAGVEKENTGHHHLLINTGLPDLKLPIPADDNHKHFGGGQTQVTLELEPGTHTLQLLMGNHIHIPHAEAVYSEQITITVE